MVLLVLVVRVIWYCTVGASGTCDMVLLVLVVRAIWYCWC